MAVTRKGGWPGEARPIWPFRADKATQDAVAAYIAANGLDPKRGRSAAINALVQAGTSGDTDRHTCVQPPSMACAACMDVYDDVEHMDLTDLAADDEESSDRTHG